ncbi:hypothetical protein BFD14_26355 [Escherichia coli]|nr:hypothetical protein BFD14_26355 [Escherichia coli]
MLFRSQRVSEAAEARRIFCNVVDAPKAASFIMPSIIDRSPLMVAVSSSDTWALDNVLQELGRERTIAMSWRWLRGMAKSTGITRSL